MVEANTESKEENYILWRLERGVAEGSIEIPKECQKLGQSNQKAKIKVENLNGLLVERQSEVEACKKEIEMQKKNLKNQDTRFKGLLDRYKDTDPEDMRASFNRLV